MEITQTPLPGVCIVKPRRFDDARGWFSESWNARAMAMAGLDIDFVQDNHSCSVAVATLRGLHFQSPPHAQIKLVRCTKGAIWDVAVDIRRGSPAFGRWTGVELSAENGHQLLVPAGFLHGFVTRQPDTEVQYKCSDTYASACDGAVRWDDPDIGIDWGLGSTAPILSDKDMKAPFLRDLQSPFTFGE